LTSRMVLSADRAGRAPASRACETFSSVVIDGREVPRGRALLRGQGRAPTTGMNFAGQGPVSGGGSRRSGG